jgi:hypothetical protein
MRKRSVRRRRRLVARAKPLVYSLQLDQATIDLLALGICPEPLAQTAFDLQRWRREAIRNTTPPKDRS